MFYYKYKLMKYFYDYGYCLFLSSLYSTKTHFNLLVSNVPKYSLFQKNNNSNISIIDDFVIIELETNKKEKIIQF